MQEQEFDDEDFDDLDLVEEGVLVIDVRENNVAEGTAVQVNGTVRRFDLEEAERLFDLDLEDETYGAFDNELVIVADTVEEESSTVADESTTTPEVAGRTTTTEAGGRTTTTVADE